uniref:Uncharacterized protein n=1 Tax=Plectus sambesii TaxID=2011161 RepID=A0A914XEW7_9BILA
MNHHQRTTLRTLLWITLFFKVLYCLTLNNQPTTDDSLLKSDKEVEYNKGSAVLGNQSVLTANASESIGDDANVTYLLDSLVKNYDKRIRPNYGDVVLEGNVRSFAAGMRIESSTTDVRKEADG